MFNKKDRKRFDNLYSEIWDRANQRIDFLSKKIETIGEENKNLVDESMKKEIENAKLKNELNIYKKFVSDFLKNENTKTILYKGEIYLITDFSLFESNSSVEPNSLDISYVATNVKTGGNKNE